jgi:hypothetical protein
MFSMTGRSAFTVTSLVDVSFFFDMQENQVGADLFRTDVKTTSKAISGFALDELYFLMCAKQISPQLLERPVQWRRLIFHTRWV